MFASRPTRPRPPRGFTMVELVVVLAVLTAMLAVAVPYVLATLPGQRASAVARQFGLMIRNGQALSAKTNAPFTVTFDAGGGCPQIVLRDGAGNSVESICMNDYPQVAIANGGVTDPLQCATSDPDVGNCSLCGSAVTMTIFPTGVVATPTTVGDSIIFTPTSGSTTQARGVGVYGVTGRVRHFRPAGGGGWECP